MYRKPLSRRATDSARMEKKQARHVEWGRIQITGQTPIVAGAAVGPEQLMWIACRTSRFLVHVFQDARLQSVWRFPSEPVWLLLKSDWGSHPLAGFNGRDLDDTRNCIILLVGTSDGGIWQLYLSPNCLQITQRPTRKRKETLSVTLPDEECRVTSPKVHESKGLSSGSRRTCDRTKRKLALEEWPTQDDNGVSVNSSSKNVAVGDDHFRYSCAPGLKCRWVKQKIHDRQNLTKKYPVKLVSRSDLLCTGAPVSVAACGPNDIVALLTPTGALDIIPLTSSRPSKGISVARFADEKSTGNRSEPTCILFVSAKIEGDNLRPGGTVASLSAPFFGKIFGESDKMYQRLGLLQGDQMGFVHTVRLDIRHPVAGSPSTVLCNLEQPIAQILVVPFNGESGQAHQYSSPVLLPSKLDKCSGDSILILGQLGRAVLLTGVRDKSNETTESPLLPSERNFSWADKSKSVTADQLAQKCLAIHEWDLNSRIASACMLGHGRLCYCTGSEVLYVDLFESMGHGTVRCKTANTEDTVRSVTANLIPCDSSSRQISNSSVKARAGKPCEKWVLREKLVPHVVPVSDVVVAIVSRGALSIPGGGSRPLVAVTWRGRLLGVELSDHVSSPLLNENDDHLSWKSLQSRKEERVQNLTQSISKVAERRVAMQRHHSFMTSILKDLADSFPLAYDICHDKARQKVGFPDLSKVDLPPPGKIHCFLSINNHPDELFVQEGLASGQIVRAASGCSDTLLKVSVKLRNLSSLTLSPSWTLLLKLRGLHTDSSAISSCSTVINRGLGLPVDSCFSHDFLIRLSNPGCCPLLASIFMCHLNDSHEYISLCRPGSNVYSMSKAQNVKETTFDELSKTVKASTWIHTGGKVSKPCLKSENLAPEDPGLVCLVLNHSKIDLISRLETPLQAGINQSPWIRMESRCEQTDAFFKNRTILGDIHLSSPANAAHILPNDDGKLRFISKDLLPDGIGTKSTYDSSLHRFASQAADVRTFAAPDSGTVCFSMDQTSSCEEDRNLFLFQTSSLLLGSLTREAILYRIRQSEEYLLLQEACSTSHRGCAMKSPEVRADRFNDVSKLMKEMVLASEQWQRVFNSRDSALFKSSLRQTGALMESILTVYRACRQHDSSLGKTSA